MKPIRGDLVSIEARTSDGKALETLVRMTYECSQTVDEGKWQEIGDLFQKFTAEVEKLL
jgi:hypothetical protein